MSERSTDTGTVDPADHRDRQVWRAAPNTQVLIWCFIAVAAVAIPLVAFASWRDGGAPAVSIGLLVLAVVAVLYGWRYGLYPRVVVAVDTVTVRNPLRTTVIRLDRVTGVEPGENGLRITCGESLTEAWCIQKSTTAIKAGRRTRADRVAEGLRARLISNVATPAEPEHPVADRSPRPLVPEASGTATPPASSPVSPDTTEFRPVAAGEPEPGRVGPEPADPSDAGELDRLEDDEPELIIRRAHPDEAEVLARMERDANLAALAHVFPPKEFPYPLTQVEQRWLTNLTDRSIRVRIAELDSEPIGFIAYAGDQVKHLGVIPDQLRHGYGGEMLDYATHDILRGDHDRVWLWVLVDNTVAQAFYRSKGFAHSGEMSTSEFAPYPDQTKMILDRSTR